MKIDKIELLFNKLINIFHIKMDDKKRELLLQVFKFTIVGAVAFIIDYSIMVICKEILHFSVLLSAFIGFTISVIYNYIASVKWVFNVNEKKSKTKNFIIFIIFRFICLILTELIMWFGTDIIKISYLIVKVIATIIVMIFNFITRKIFLEK